MASSFSSLVTKLITDDFRKSENEENVFTLGQMEGKFPYVPSGWFGF